ncbi:MAG: glycerophosphodiester phosphodiesterase [Gammaproteobacteria bacterium]|nr:glycerophosphodiester phosphodiesterase [Gammaproteobacteria bacterium]
MNDALPVPQLIAHRGYSQCYPENTLAGLLAALQAGARYFEFDVHFTKDNVPVVFHDSELSRTTGHAGDIHQSTWAQLSTLHAGEPGRFGDRFNDEPVPTLKNVLQLLDRWPQATAFVEIKRRTVVCFGVEHVAQRMVAELAQYCTRCVLISFDLAVLAAVKKLGTEKNTIPPIGWVIREWGSEAQQAAQQLQPEVLICNYKKIPDTDGALWSGPWRWALYDIVNPALALHWAQRGAHFIETWDIGGMLADPRLAEAACDGD